MSAEDFNEGHDRGAITAYLRSALWNVQQSLAVEEILNGKWTEFDEEPPLVLDLEGVLEKIEAAYRANLDVQ